MYPSWAEAFRQRVGEHQGWTGLGGRFDPRMLEKSKKDVGLNYALQLANSYTTDGINVLRLRLYPQDIIHWHEIALATARMMKNRNAERCASGQLGLSLC